MKIDDIMEGLSIVRKYYNENCFHVGAEHDEIFAYPTDRSLSPEDVARMFDLGWIQVDVETDDDGNAAYDPECGWVAYV